MLSKHAIFAELQWSFVCQKYVASLKHVIAYNFLKKRTALLVAKSE